MQSPTNITDIEAGPSPMRASTLDRLERVLKGILFLFGSSVATYYSIMLLSMFGDLALKSGSELKQKGNLEITPLSFNAYQEKAYIEYQNRNQNHTFKCKLGIISSFPPVRCGIGQFSEDLYYAMKKAAPNHCQVSVIAFHDSSSGGTLASLFRSYDKEKVEIIIDLDNSVPSPAILKAASEINDAGFTQLLVQSEFGLTPIMWQQTDLLRWLSPNISVVTVFHTPRAYPNEEERALLRQLSRLSSSVVTMSHYGCHSLEHVYGVPSTKVNFIPHGVKDIYADMGEKLSSGSITRTNPEKFILLSDGLIHDHKGYLRVIRALPELVKIYPNIVFRIVGKQHPKSAAKNLMDSYINEARALGVRRNLEWIDTFFTPEELLNYYLECDIYISLYDEITPISGTITAAMAAGLTIVATPYRYAVELLSNGCGVVLPSFDINYNGSFFLVKALSELLAKPSLRRLYGERAASRVASWRWPKTASAYWRLFNITSTIDVPDIHPDLFENALDSSAFWSGSNVFDFLGNLIPFPEEKYLKPAIQLLSSYTFSSPSKFPIEESSSSSIIEETSSSTSFSEEDGGELIELFSIDKGPERLDKEKNLSKDLFCSQKSSNIFNCLYVIYADSNIQINGAIYTDGTIRVLGIRTPLVYILVQGGLPIDIEENSIDMDGMSIEYHTSNRVTLKTKSSVVNIDNSNFGITIQIYNVSRFSSPKGIIGSTLRFKFDEFTKISNISSTNWSEWRLDDENLFSIQSKGQSWSMFSIEANTYYIPSLHDLPRNSMSYYINWISASDSRSTSVRLVRDVFPLVSEKNYVAVITVQFEGPLFDYSGFATVNRALFMELIWKSSRIMVRLTPTDSKIDTSNGAKPPHLDSVIKYLMWANIAASRPSSDILFGVIKNIGSLKKDRNTIGSVSRESTPTPFAHMDSIFQPRRNQPSLISSEPMLAGILLRLFPLLATSIEKKDKNGVGLSDGSPDIVFRNAWLGGGGPDFSLPLSISTFWIQSQPWEYWGIPESWLASLKMVDALVVPSNFSKDSYLANGVESDRVVTLPHGVTFNKIQRIIHAQSNDSLQQMKNLTVKMIKELPGCSKFVAVFSGGLLARKGVDVAIKAFLSAFKRSDEACLVMHSVYGDGYYFDEIKGHQADYEAAEIDPSLIWINASRYDIPRIVYLDTPIEWTEMISLFNFANLFIAPYRAEGFGLIILEAMAAGTAVAVTQAGPALEFTDSDSVFYISQETPKKDDDDDGPSGKMTSTPIEICKISPCGPGLSEINGSKTKIPPRWAAPSVNSLQTILQTAYKNPYLITEKAAKGVELARKHSWTQPGVQFEILLKRLVIGSDSKKIPVPQRLKDTLSRLKNEKSSNKGADNILLRDAVSSLENTHLTSSSDLQPATDESLSLSDIFTSVMSLSSTLGMWIINRVL